MGRHFFLARGAERVCDCCSSISVVLPLIQSIAMGALASTIAFWMNSLRRRDARDTVTSEEAKRTRLTVLVPSADHDSQQRASRTTVHHRSDCRRAMSSPMCLAAPSPHVFSAAGRQVTSSNSTRYGPPQDCARDCFSAVFQVASSRWLPR